MGHAVCDQNRISNLERQLAQAKTIILAACLYVPQLDWPQRSWREDADKWLADDRKVK